MLASIWPNLLVKFVSILQKLANIWPHFGKTLLYLHLACNPAMVYFDLPASHSDRPHASGCHEPHAQRAHLLDPHQAGEAEDLGSPFQRDRPLQGGAQNRRIDT